MPGVLDTFKVTLEPAKAYLVILCFLQDAVADGIDGDRVIM